MTMASDKNPQHIALIMDGNRRWAEKKGVGVLYDDASKKAVYTSLAFCLKQGIPHCSLYAFSLENLNSRSAVLRERLFDLLIEVCTNEAEKLAEKGIKVRFVGQREVFPARVLPAIKHLEKTTAHNTTLQLNILFCYGAQQEVAAACKAIAKKVASGQLVADQIVPATVTDYLWTADTPAPDMIIRTGGVTRLSNFLLFQAAYSELMFLECLWPELTEAHLQDCVTRFHHTARNFGK
jgi:undecaprenyl diphosphate synthase